MPLRTLLTVVFLLLFSTLARVQTDERSSDRAYIRQAESDWAESTATNDVSVLERILADDFVGVDIDGSHYSKAGAIKDYRTKPSEFVFNHLNDVEIRFYGETAVRRATRGGRRRQTGPPASSSGPTPGSGEAGNGRS